MFGTIADSMHQGAPPYGAYSLQKQFMLLEPPTIYQASPQLWGQHIRGQILLHASGTAGRGQSPWSLLQNRKFIS